MDEHPDIGFREGALGRRAILAGTRLDVWQVIETVRASGNSVQEAAEYLGLAPSRVQAAIDYYTAYRSEVDDIASRERTVSESAEAVAQRLRFMVNARGFPIVRAIDPADITIALFLDHERARLPEVEALLTSVIRGEADTGEYAHEVWTLTIAQHAAQLEFDYDDEPTVLPPEGLLALAQAWRRYLDSVPGVCRDLADPL
jgi:uncharacterized protein (DUF433 family)